MSMTESTPWFDQPVPPGTGDIYPFRNVRGNLEFLDQRFLPLVEKWVIAKTPEDYYRVIKDMIVRGAPAIGIAGAFGFASAFQPNIVDGRKLSQAEALSIGTETERLLSKSRPTAVNLSWALRRLARALEIWVHQTDDTVTIYDGLLREAWDIWSADISANRAMAANGQRYIPPGGVLTHCNAGALATGGVGTAIGVITERFRTKNDIIVYVDETRPYLQGARLTAYELDQCGVPIRLICDNMAAFLMSLRKIQSIIVGADRIAANGDTANKIGTLNLAILAKHYNIPFFVAAPVSTVDIYTEEGSGIPIEYRDIEEILSVKGERITKDFPGENPAFDITPAELITALITEQGVIESPDKEKIQKLCIN